MMVISSGMPPVDDRCWPVCGFRPERLCQFVIKTGPCLLSTTKPVPVLSGWPLTDILRSRDITEGFANVTSGIGPSGIASRATGRMLRRRVSVQSRAFDHTWGQLVHRVPHAFRSFPQKTPTELASVLFRPAP